MTLFEYVTVAVSIVLSLSVVRSLEAAGSVLDRDRRDPVHAAWFAIKTFQPMLLWWSIWGLHESEGWNFLAFVLCMASPVLLHLQVVTLTGRAPEAVPDWWGHFEDSRRRFFGANIAMAATGPALLLSLGLPAGPLAIGSSVEIALGATAMLSGRRAVQVAVVAITAAVFVAWTFLLFAPAGSAVPS